MNIDPNNECGPLVKITTIWPIEEINCTCKFLPWQWFHEQSDTPFPHALFEHER